MAEPPTFTKALLAYQISMAKRAYHLHNHTTQKGGPPWSSTHAHCQEGSSSSHLVFASIWKLQDLHKSHGRSISSTTRNSIYFDILSWFSPYSSRAFLYHTITNEHPNPWQHHKAFQWMRDPKLLTKKGALMDSVKPTDEDLQNAGKQVCRRKLISPCRHPYFLRLWHWIR